MSEPELSRRRFLHTGLFGLALVQAPPLWAVCRPTGGDIEGPLYRKGAPARTALCGPTEPGQPLGVSGLVRGPDCRPLGGALLEVWQANDKGTYSEGEGEDFLLRGQILAGPDGRYEFASILPGAYGGRPRHIHFIVRHPQAGPLTTQMYFEGDERLAHERGVEESQVIRLAEASRRLTGIFDITLGPA